MPSAPSPEGFSVLGNLLSAHSGPFLDNLEGDPWTYEAAAEETARFSSWLRSRKIRRGETVAVALGNSSLAAIVWFGLLRDGIAIVPLNPSLTDEEIAYILRMAEAKMIIAEEAIHPSAVRWIEETGARIEPVRAEERPWNAYEPAESVYVDPDDIAVIFFTSGTTGRPKGAMLTHRALLANAAGCGATFGLDATASFACSIPIFHSFAATVCLFLPALLGGRAYFHSPRDPGGFLQRLAGLENPRIVVGVPSILGALVMVSGGKIPNVRFVVSGGAALPLELRRKLAVATGAPVYEGYGTTECGPVISAQCAELENTEGSVGKAIRRVEVEIRSSDGNRVPHGEVGEIVVRTPALMAGYYDLASATRATIKGGWFHTGDLGYVAANGEFFIVDRLSDAITVKGITVLPQYVENEIRSHPGVLESAVVGVPDGAGGEIPWAFVRLAPGTVENTQELLSYLRNRLPVYAVPRGVEFRNELPKTITGKILKRTLRQKWL